MHQLKIGRLPGISQEEKTNLLDNTDRYDRVTGEDGVAREFSSEGVDGKNGINPENQLHATDSMGNKSRITMEYDGISLHDSGSCYLALQDIDTFTDGERSWTLAKGDVVSGLPGWLADPLLDRGALREVGA